MISHEEVTNGTVPVFEMSEILVTTWNIAAVNNNPFEYWVTHHDPAYNKLMADVQSVMDSPREHDQEVGSILSDEMYHVLVSDMQEAGMFDGISDGQGRLKDRWSKDLCRRRAVSGFLADRNIGSKRLASMPDRITNTIRPASGGALFRPAVINCFEGDLDDLPSWWRQWREFMFRTPVRVHGGDADTPQLVCRLLEPLSRAKYPAVTEEEEAISVPLQVMAWSAPGSYPAASETPRRPSLVIQSAKPPTHRPTPPAMAEISLTLRAAEPRASVPSPLIPPTRPPLSRSPAAAAAAAAAAGVPGGL